MRAFSSSLRLLFWREVDRKSCGGYLNTPPAVPPLFPRAVAPPSRLSASFSPHLSAAQSAARVARCLTSCPANFTGEHRWSDRVCRASKREDESRVLELVVGLVVLAEPECLDPRSGAGGAVRVRRRSRGPAAAARLGLLRRAAAERLRAVLQRLLRQSLRELNLQLEKFPHLTPMFIHQSPRCAQETGSKQLSEPNPTH